VEETWHRGGNTSTVHNCRWMTGVKAKAS